MDAPTSSNNPPVLRNGMSAVEAARLLGVSERTIRRAIARGELRAFRHGRSFCIDPVELRAFRQRTSFTSGHDQEVTTERRFIQSTQAPQRLVGRERDVGNVLDLLRRPGVRLVTITGTGGVGKSSLAENVAFTLEPDLRDGVVSVDLTVALQPDDVARVMAEAAGIYPGQRSSEHAVLDYFGSKEALILLDNFEHVLEAEAFVARLLDSCTGCISLVTSRTPLSIDLQHEYRLHPLRTPEPGETSQISLRQAADATRLFVARVREFDPGFALDENNATEVSEIVRRTDGIPLAIEMAAAQAPRYSIPELLARLESRTPVLVAVRTPDHVRHQTLVDTIAWSYDLLEPMEQRVFRAVSAVPGGIGTELTAALLPDIDAPVIETVLKRLAAKSLIQPSATEGRYSMLETVRQFGIAALEREGEWDTLRSRAIHFVLNLAEEFARAFRTDLQRAWIDRIRGELPGIRAALTWAIDLGEKDSALRIAYALRMYWAHAGRLSECLEWSTRALDLPGQASPVGEASGLVAAAYAAKQRGDAKTSERLLNAAVQLLATLGPTEPLAIAFETLGDLALNTGDFAKADEYHQKMLDVAVQTGSGALIASARNGLGLVMAMKGNYDAAVEVLTGALEEAEASGDPRTSARVANSMAMAHTWAGDLARATQRYHQSLAFFRSIDDRRDMFVVLNNLGHVALNIGRLEEAESLLEEAKAGLISAGDRLSLAMALSNLGILARARQEPEKALQTFAEATEVFIGFGDRRLIAEALALCGVCLADLHEWAKSLTTFTATLRLFPDMEGFLDSGTMDLRRIAEQDARAALDSDERSKAIELGESIDLDRLLVLVRHSKMPAAIDENIPDDVPLTRRELEILNLLADGLTDQQIADQLFLSKRTVSTHVASILAKLGVESRTAAASVAFRRNLVS